MHNRPLRASRPARPTVHPLRCTTHCRVLPIFALRSTFRGRLSRRRMPPMTTTPQRTLAGRIRAAQLGFALILALASAPVLAQHTSLSPEKRGRLGEVVSRFKYAHSVPGISAAVLQDGKGVWSEGFG